MIGAQPNETGGTFTTSIHWDGNSVLFISDSGGAGDVELRAGELAMMSSVGIDVLDRDMSGAMVADHDSTGFSAWSASTTYSTGGETCKQAFSGDCSGTSSILQTGSYPVGFDQGNSHEFLQTHLDGYNDGYGNTFQGVRSQDSNSQQWSTPDAYAGEVDDPMTQKPFMYNRNNPMEYTDPSGYVPVNIGWLHFDVKDVSSKAAVEKVAGGVGVLVGRAAGKVVGTVIGKPIGGLVGAAVGGVMGSEIPVVGSAGGALVGGMAGTVAGGKVGSSAGQFVGARGRPKDWNGRRRFNLQESHFITRGWRLS